MAEASTVLKAMFVALGVTLGALFVAGVRAAWQRTGASPAAALRATLFALAGTCLWMGATWALAASGRLSFESRPPTMLLMVLVSFALGLVLATSSAGERLARGLPLWALVGVHAFRLPLELMMHRAATEGVMPVQMSYSGYNFDIVTGITAIAVAAGIASGRLGARAAAAWNAVGSVLLLVILTIAFVSTPLPIRIFMNEPANVWITREPFIWLPTVMVLLALVGHVVLFRRLRLQSVRSGATGAASDAAAR